MIKILAGGSNPELAEEIAEFLGETLTKVKLTQFKDKELYVKIEDSIRGHDVFIIQSTCYPANDNLIQLLLMIDAAKRASAESITAVIPYFGYARQDRKAEPREPISSKLIADLLQVAGVSRVLTVDLHANQQQGFFDVPVDDLWAAPIFKGYFDNIDNVVIVSPDAGAVVRARRLAKMLNNVPIAVIDKRRTNHNESEVMYVLGDVKGKNAIIFDDMIDSGGTVIKAAKAVKEAGANKVFLCATHGVFSSNALEKLQACTAEEIVVTNTIPNSTNDKVKVLSIAPLVGTAIKNIYKKDSVSALAGTDIKTKLVIKSKV